MREDTKLVLFLFTSTDLPLYPQSNSQNASAKSQIGDWTDPNDVLVLFLSFLHILPVSRPAQLPDSSTVPTLFRHLSSLLSSPTRLFLCLLRRPPPVACLRRWDFPSQPSSWPIAWLSPVPRHLLFLLAASMALPGRRPRGRLLKLASPNPEPRGEDTCTEKSSPESVSTGDSTKPTLGFWRPQPFPTCSNPD